MRRGAATGVRVPVDAVFVGSSALDGRAQGINCGVMVRLVRPSLAAEGLKNRFRPMPAARAREKEPS